MSTAVKVAGLIASGVVVHCVAELIEYSPGVATGMLNAVTGILWVMAGLWFVKGLRDMSRPQPPVPDKKDEVPHS